MHSYFEGTSTQIKKSTFKNLLTSLASLSMNGWVRVMAYCTNPAFCPHVHPPCFPCAVGFTAGVRSGPVLPNPTRVAAAAAVAVPSVLLAAGLSLPGGVLLGVGVSWLLGYGVARWGGGARRFGDSERSRLRK